MINIRYPLEESGIVAGENLMVGERSRLSRGPRLLDWASRVTCCLWRHCRLIASFEIRFHGIMIILGATGSDMVHASSNDDDTMTYKYSCRCSCSTLPVPIPLLKLRPFLSSLLLLISIGRDVCLDLLKVPQCRLEIPSILSETHRCVLSVHPCSLPYLLDQCLLGIIGCLDTDSIKHQ